MQDLRLTKTRLIGGVWEGILTGAGDTAPHLTLKHLAEDLPGLTTERDPETGGWLVRAAIPQDRIADGIQTFVIAISGTGQILTSFAILAGEALTDDIRAELDLLRAELDLLKQAFRRHCVDTASDT